MTPGPFDGVQTELIETFLPAIIAGATAVAVAALGYVLIKWGIPQIIGMFKRIAK